MNNQSLIKHLVSTGALKTPSIIAAFEAIDRANFVRGVAAGNYDEYENDTYGDYPLPIGYGATISQPATVAFMLELLNPLPGNKVLDVGCGSGWTTALLAHCVSQKVETQKNDEKEGKVFALDIVPELVEFAKTNVEKYRFVSEGLVDVRIGDGHQGLPEEAPFDRILVSAAAEILPQKLVDQLAVNGILVIPVGPSVFQIQRISATEVSTKEFYGFAFVPLVEPGQEDLSNW